MRTLVALRDLYGHEAGARAMEDAFASEYIAHVLAQGARFIPEASAFPLPRRAARLAGRVPPPARSLYHAPPQPTAQETEAPDTLEHRQEPQARARPPGDVAHSLRDLKLAVIAEHSGALAKQAAGQPWAPGPSWARLLAGEAHLRRDRATHPRLRQALRWAWPTQLHRLQGPHHCGRGVSKARANLISLGGGVGQTPLATTVGSTACLQGSTGLLAHALEVLNTLAAAKKAGRLKQARKKYTKPALRILDERGALPMDKSGAELLCPVIRLR